MPYVTEATRVQLVLPLPAAETPRPAFLETTAAGVWSPGHALLTLLLVLRAGRGRG